MTDAQFDALTKLMRARFDSASNLAARAVLVEGATAAQAALALGVSRMQVANAVNRYREAHTLVIAAYCPDSGAPKAPAKTPGRSRGRRRTSPEGATR